MARLVPLTIRMDIDTAAAGSAAMTLAYDLGRMNRNALESLRLGELVEATQVRLVGASDGFDSSNQQSKIMLAMMSSFNEVFIDQLKAKVHRGQTVAFNRGEIVQHPGFGYRLVDVLTPEGKPELTRKNTIKKRVEVDPEAAEWIVRGAEMIVRDNRSPGAVAVVFNDNNVGGARTWSSNRIRKLYARERLVGVEVFRRTKQVRDRDTGHVDVVQKDRAEWMTRECPELRILTDELAEAVKAKLNLGSMRFGKNAADLRRDGKDPGRRVDVYPTVLVRPVCGGCGKPMALSRSTGKYKSFVCLNSIHGGHGCRNKGNKSARIIDEAVLKAVSAQIFDDGFITDLTAEVNIRLAEAARRPQDTAKRLEQEIASRQRQVGRLTERLEKVQDGGGLDTIFDKVAELSRQLEAKRAELKEEQRRNRRPPVTCVKEQEVVVALTQLREVLLSDVGRAAPVLQALVGDVVIESRQVEGQKRPEMVAKFTIDGIPALAALDRGKAAGDDDPTVGMWEYLHGDRWITGLPRRHVARLGRERLDPLMDHRDCLFIDDARRQLGHLAGAAAGDPLVDHRSLRMACRDQHRVGQVERGVQRLDADRLHRIERPFLIRRHVFKVDLRVATAGKVVA